MFFVFEKGKILHTKEFGGASKGDRLNTHTRRRGGEQLSKWGDDVAWKSICGVKKGGLCVWGGYSCA